MNFKRTNLNYVLAFILILLLVIRSSIIRDIISPLFFYFYIIALNIYLIISEKIIISKSGIYLLFTCTISLVLGLIFGWINPVLNSWNRLLIFFLMFNILGPLIINKNSTAFRSILFQLLLYALPIILLIDSFYVIYFRKITLGGHVWIDLFQLLSHHQLRREKRL